MFFILYVIICVALHCTYFIALYYITSYFLNCLVSHDASLYLINSLYYCMSHNAFCFICVVINLFLYNTVRYDIIDDHLFDHWFY